MFIENSPTKQDTKRLSLGRYQRHPFSHCSTLDKMKDYILTPSLSAALPSIASDLKQEKPHTAHPHVSGRSVESLLNEAIKHASADETEDALFVADLGEVVAQYNRFRKLLPA